MTVQEFLTAVQAGGTVNVDTDIDFNAYSFSESVTIPTSTIINGNGHTLTNIQQGTSTYIFGFSGDITINNLNIRNLNLTSIHLFNGSAGDHVLNECQISGNCYRLYSSGQSQYARNITYNRCSMHIGRFDNIRGTLNDCYVIVENNLTTSSSGNVSLLGDYASNTYFKGNLKITGTITISTSFSNCCINIDVDDSTYTISLTQASDPVSVLNSDKMSNTNRNSHIIAVTDTEMHDAQSLFDVGFNIYVPST